MVGVRFILSNDLSEDLPKILVCMPTLNREWVIKYSIGSILEQDYPRDKIRLIIVDGGSRDRTIEIAKEILTRGGLSYEIIIRKSNISQARNLCLDRLRDEEVIIMWDSDTIAHRETLLQIVKTLRSEKYDIIGIMPEFHLIRDESDVIRLRNTLSRTLKDIRISTAYHVPGAFMSFRKALLERFNLRFNEKLSFYEDVDFCKRALEKRLCIGRIEGIPAYDIDLPKKEWSDIYVSMPVRRYLSGWSVKGDLLAYQAFFEKRNYIVWRALYHIFSLFLLVLSLIFFAERSLQLGILFVVVYLFFSHVYILDYLRRGYDIITTYKKLLRTQIIALPINAATIISYLKYRLKSGGETDLLSSCN